VCDFANTEVSYADRGDACNTANQTRAEGQPPSAISEVNAAYDNIGTTAAYYQSTLGIDLTALIGSVPAGGSSKALRAATRVCFTHNPCPLNNAFWDGQQSTYGQGYAAAQDVVAHELAHGVTEKTSNLAYLYQSGAINESMSDVFGELVDLSDGVNLPDTAGTWLVGEDAPGGAIRSMSDPGTHGQPDRMTSPDYTADESFTDNGGVHTNSGVGNKAAYLIGQGGTFNGQTVTGLGLPKTAVIYYRTLSVLATGADYADLGATLSSSCLALVGTAGIVAPDCAEVDQAVTATEMAQQPTVVGAAAPEAPVCDPGKTQQVLFDDNMESTAYWSTSGTFADWSYAQGYATSARTMLDGYTPEAGAPPGAHAGVAQAVPLYVTAGQTTYLRFRHYDQFEFGYDGGHVQYSVNSGSTWIDAGGLPTDNGYNADVHLGTPTTQFRGFSKQSAGYVSTRINVSSLGGRSVLFRFRIVGDESVASDWLIDDVSLYQCGYPTAMTASSPPSAVYGFAVTMTGTLRYAGSTTAVPPMPVRLLHRKRGTSTWYTLVSTRSSASGTFAFLVKPAYHTDYQARFDGSTSFLPTISPTFTVSSLPRVITSVSPTSVPRGGTAKISVTVQPNHSGQQVTLQRLVGTMWTWVAYGNLTTSSTYAFSVRPTVAGTYTYRVYKSADPDHGVGISPNITLRVT